MKVEPAQGMCQNEYDHLLSSFRRIVSFAFQRSPWLWFNFDGGGDLAAGSEANGALLSRRHNDGDCVLINVAASWSLVSFWRRNRRNRRSVL